MADENPASRTRRPDPLSALWRVLASPGTGMILLALLALALVLADLIPQIPSQARSDPRAWLAVRLGASGWRSLVGALHLFDLSHSLWFRVLLALIGLVLLVHLIDAAELAWRARGQGRWTAASFRFWSGDRPPLRLPSVSALEAAPAWLGEQLEAHGWRWSTVLDCPVHTVVASRRAPLLWVRPAGHAALLAALVGLAVLSVWGWQGAEWQPYAGQSHPVQNNSLLQVRLDGFETSEAEAGGSGSTQSQISWLQGDAVLARAWLAYGRPAVLHGLSVRQMGYTPAIRIRGIDKGGAQLVFQEEGRGQVVSEVGLVFSSPQARPLLFLPRQNLFLAFRFQAQCGSDEPELHVDLLRGDGSSQEALGILHESGSVAFDGLRVDVELTYRPILRTDYRPGILAVGGGAALALLAAAVTWIVPTPLVWIAVGPGEGGAAMVEMVARAGEDASGLGSLGVALREAPTRAA